MRLVYGVFGYGRGHATRALGVLPELTRRHAVRIFASGRAFEMIAPRYPDVVETPRLDYTYRTSGRRCLWRTARDNATKMGDALVGGRHLRRVEAAIRAFGPDVAISDCETYVHHAAARLGIPRIAFDHFGILTHCRPPIDPRDRLKAVRDVMSYRMVVGFPARAVVSSFFDAPAVRRGVRCVGPLLREEVRRTRPRRGEHLLVYLNNGDRQLLPHVEEALNGCGTPVVVYGTSRRGEDGRVAYRAPSDEGFLEDVARATALFTTAGNQLVGEAVYLGKPMLVSPEHTVEQRVNGMAIERLGVGRMVAFSRIRAEGIRSFLRDAPRYATTVRVHARDGRAEAVEALERFAAEVLRERKALGAARVWRYAQ
ncbi:MAG: glycosyltransferase family protein [Myxococcota bacterium]